jgi:hypothetical protein
LFNMGKMQLRQEARALQGKSIAFGDRSLKIAGESSRAEFESGSEGLVHLATDERSGESFRIKCFWEPDDMRRRRSEYLVALQLVELNKPRADALGGAPFGMLPPLGASTPFAVLMRNVRGESWRKLRTRAEAEAEYPPKWWPPVAIRATWAYGLATAVTKMEARGFVHADISPGNIVVNDGLHGTVSDAGSEMNDDDAGDMALVDFDRYVHGSAEVSELGQGTAGYAAPEVWAKQLPQVGTDRASMAILIQEFIVVGDPELCKEEALDWSYDQESCTFQAKPRGDSPESRNASAHPLLARKYPELAALVEATVHATKPEARPAPQSWRGPLRDIVYPGAPSAPSRLCEVTLIQVADISQPYHLVFTPAMRMLDLSETRFRIHASLKRDADGSAYLAVHSGAIVDVRLTAVSTPNEYRGPTRIEVRGGMVLMEPGGAMSVRLQAPIR